MNPKAERIVAASKRKSEKRQAEVLRVVEIMVKTGQRVTFNGVAQITGASKAFLYGNPVVKEAIEVARDKTASNKMCFVNMLSAFEERLQRLESTTINQAGPDSCVHMEANSGR